jgi:hypothetical protein
LGLLDTLRIKKKLFFKIASNPWEYEKNIHPTDSFLDELAKNRIDVFTFIERGWCCKAPSLSRRYVQAEDNIALIELTSFDEWWQRVGKKTRNMARKAEKSGIKTEAAVQSEKLSEGIWKIYNETPFRQERAFHYYGQSLRVTREYVLSAQSSTFIAAYMQDELVGFLHLIHGDNVSIISQILGLQKHADKAINNALVAKAIQVCTERGVRWVMYGRMGNHPTLDRFKESNGFRKFTLNRFYLPLTGKGRLAVRLGLHRELKDTLPQWIKDRLFGVYNWVSRLKMRRRQKRLEQEARQ